VGARRPLLEADVQCGGGEINLVLAQVHKFGDAQAMAERHKDHGGVAVPPTVTLGRRNKPLNLAVSRSRNGD
jgi:hypothetical protein